MSQKGAALIACLLALGTIRQFANYRIVALRPDAALRPIAGRVPGSAFAAVCRCALKGIPFRRLYSEFARGVIPMYGLTMEIRTLLLFALVLGVATQRSSALVVWDESVNGPLASSGNAPTTLSLSLGSNTIISSFGGSARFDYFTFTLAAGQGLNGFALDSYVSTDPVAWLGLKSGADWTIEYDTSRMIGQQHFGAANVGMGLLGISSANPLGPGTYTVRSQQLGASANYQLDLSVVPEPSTYALLVLTGVGSLWWVKRRRAAGARPAQAEKNEVDNDRTMQTWGNNGR